LVIIKLGLHRHTKFLLIINPKNELSLYISCLNNFKQECFFLNHFDRFGLATFDQTKTKQKLTEKTKQQYTVKSRGNRTYGFSPWKPYTFVF